MRNQATKTRGILLTLFQVLFVDDSTFIFKTRSAALTIITRALREVWSPADVCQSKWQHIQDGSNPLPKSNKRVTDPAGTKDLMQDWRVFPLHQLYQIPGIIRDTVKPRRQSRHIKENCIRIQGNGAAQAIIHEPRSTFGHHTPNVSCHPSKCSLMGL